MKLAIRTSTGEIIRENWPRESLKAYVRVNPLARIVVSVRHKWIPLEETKREVRIKEQLEKLRRK